MTMTDTGVDSNRYLDLDAAFDEAEDLTVKLGGQEWTIPGQPSAKVMMKFLRYVDGGTLSNQHVEDFFRMLVGPESYDGMMEAGMTYQQMEHLVQWLLSEYGITGSGAGGPGNVTQE